MKIKKANLTTLMIIFFLLFGTVFGGIGVGLGGMGLKMESERVSVDAMITRIERYGSDDHDVYVSYEYDGELYENIRLNEYSSSMREGKKIELMVDPENPYRVADTFVLKLIGAIFGIIGLCFIITVIALVVKSKRRKAMVKRLKANGFYVEADIECVDTTNVRVNNRPTYVIRCTYRNPSTGMMYAFKSEAFLNDPTPLLDGDTIKVYVDESNYMNNYVDVDELMERYIEC